MKKKDVELCELLTRKREQRRLKRIRQLKIVRRSRKSDITRFRGTKYPLDIIIPENLDLQQNRGLLIDLIRKIRRVFFSDGHFRLDHSYMKFISEEALLVITAEIERCTTLADMKLKADHKLFPKDANVLKLLNKIGYWDYFKLDSRKNVDPTDEKLYLKIVGDTEVSGEKIGHLIQFFEKLICFEAETKDKFSDAMLEAAANTVEHAYTNDKSYRIINKWWLTASLNKNTKEISFIFYDQGLGILNTLESTQKHIKLQRVFMGWIKEGLSKGGLLKRLMTTNLSSYKDERRGNGLISFKTFIDEVESGELTIYTGNVSYSAISDKISDFDDNLDGTLIAWKIKVNNGNDKCIYIRGTEDNDQSKYH